MNIGDSEEEARAAFDDYISKYYPELSQAMDLSNWGPVGTPDDIAAWIREFADAGVDHFICRFGAIDQFGQVERFAQRSAAAVPHAGGEVSDGRRVDSRAAARTRRWSSTSACRSRRTTSSRSSATTSTRDAGRAPSPRCASSAAPGRSIMNNEMQVRRGRADMRFPMAPPRNLHQAMVGSDEVIIITNLEWANRFAHVSAVKETCAANGKIASVEPGMGAWGLTVEDLAARARSARGTRWRRSRAKKQVRVTTGSGTDFTVSIEGRPALEVTPIKQRGQMMGPLPLWAEVAFAAVEDFTHGTAVVDGVMLGIGLPGQVDGADHLDDRGRQGVKIEGGDEARAAARGDRRRRERDRDRRVRVRRRARSRRSAPRRRRAASAPCTSRSATTTTPIRAARTSARCTSTASS